jgi:hypothetical protein
MNLQRQRGHAADRAQGRTGALHHAPRDARVNLDPQHAEPGREEIHRHTGTICGKPTISPLHVRTMTSTST